ncbi:hypothetical protein ACSNOI_03295 [Actinomadura kijaniata]|uniref:hypothetical protein n=1 Tax=Actinomadura kijaniata TaxID=46161 RepID=UPI003F1A100C
MTRGPARLRDCRDRDVVVLPGHHPAVVRLDDVPAPSWWPDGLIPLAWNALDGADCGITSYSPDTLVHLLHRP